jgi:hypothetical protein
MNKVIISLLLSVPIVTSSYAFEPKTGQEDYSASPSLTEQQLMDKIRQDPDLLSKHKQLEALRSLHSESADQPEMDETTRRRLLAKRKQLQAQKLLEYYTLRHKAAAARRNGDMDFNPDAKSKLANKDRAQEKFRGVDQVGLEDKSKIQSLEKYPLEENTHKSLGDPYKTQQEDVYAPYAPKRRYIPEYKKDKYAPAEDATQYPGTTIEQPPQPYNHRRP